MQESKPESDASDYIRLHSYSNAHQFNLNRDVAIDKEIARFKDIATAVLSSPYILLLGR